MSKSETIRDWGAGLQAFTQRNAGRRTILEEAHSAAAARAEENDYPFRGVSWDARDGRVQIMLGEQGSVELHLTRSIPAARRIELLRSEGGRDRALRITHDEGQTLLRFVNDEAATRKARGGS